MVDEMVIFLVRAISGCSEFSIGTGPRLMDLVGEAGCFRVTMLWRASVMCARWLRVGRSHSVEGARGHIG